MNKKIKLCYAINEYNKFTSTHYKAKYELLESLSNDVDLFLIFEKKGDKVDINCKHHYTSKFSFLPVRWIELFIVTVWARVLGYNRFYSHYTTFSRINMPIIARLTFAKSYHWHCGLIKMFMSKFSFRYDVLKDKFLNEYPEILSWKLNHYLVTGNNGMRKIYLDDYSVPFKKNKNLPNWVDFKKFNPNNFRYVKKKNYNISENKQTLLFVHKLVPRKGADMIVPIASELLKIRTDFEILVIGYGDYKSILEEEIRKSKLENYIKILGKIPNDKLPVYFSISNLFIMPSKEEGFPHVLLEAMAMNVKFVGTDVGGVKEMVAPSLKNYIVEPNNAKLFAKKVDTLLNSKKDDKLREFAISNYNMDIVKNIFTSILK